MKKNIIILMTAALTLTTATSCNDWLDVLPNNEQVTDDYWKSKEDVEAVIASGYYYMRQCVPTFIKWGELRGGALYSINTTDAKLQDFNMTPTVSILFPKGLLLPLAREEFQRGAARIAGLCQR